MNVDLVDRVNPFDAAYAVLSKAMDGAAKVGGRTAREERIIAGFEDVRFRDAHGHAPRHGDDLDIFERLYAVRLARLREMPDAQSLLAEFDSHGLLAGAAHRGVAVSQLDDEGATRGNALSTRTRPGDA